ncbi:hypothetical protein [Pusillimonas sp. ANT_WB101]|uniref:hypothetical protein n=1 Tax=Pusillimonas sp. ANT_WB101 TaxID=2597356 RepID=UPI0011ED6A59|nr:hypothetical protein [Pusillimonas sp. ANT_WB101]KAA0911306.1 hypothetical protein FQ179_05550 [Pusillimonas sp. ANT_WB101]NYT76956.1 hypothetical protein [Alcaligenaceae bacterium]
MGDLTGAIIVVVTFAVSFGLVRAIVLYRNKRAAERKQAVVAAQALEKSLQPPSKNKNKRRREQRKNSSGS